MFNTKKVFNKALFFFLITIIIANAQDQKFGLYMKDSFNKIPLEKINYNVSIVNSIAQIQLYQTYSNSFSHPIQTEFYFPISEDAIFDKFEAHLEDGSVIVGTIKEKQQARTEYQQNLQAGNTVGYAEMNQNAHDIMQVKLGNLLPHQQITILFSYLQKVPVALNQFNEFIIYSTITQRYNPDTTKQPSLPINDIPPSKQTYKWNINVTIQQNAEISFLKCPSHQINITYLNNEKSSVNICTRQEEDPNKDFVLLFKTKNMFEPQLTVETHPDFQQEQKVISVSFFPEFNKMSADEALGFLSKFNYRFEQILIDSDIKHSEGEFIFIIDRSGSMQGDRINNLKKALNHFLEILPINCYFNIISFGGQFQLMFPQSIAYNKQNIQNVQETVNKFEANFGGTEILSPIQAAFQQPIIESHPRKIFLLTDGDVYNTDQIIQTIKQNCEETQTRFYTIGIGNGISPYLIKESAAVGKGQHIFVKDQDDLQSKTKFLVYSSISPFISNIKVHYTQPVNSQNQTIEYINKNDRNSQILLKNEMFQQFLIVNSSSQESLEQSSIEITFFNSFLKKQQTFEFKLTKEHAKYQTNDIYHKMAFHEKIKNLIKKSNDNNLDYSNCQETKQQINEQIVQISVKYQILCEKTAFITVIQYNDLSEKEKQALQNITIDQITSVDYLQNQIENAIFEDEADSESVAEAMMPEYVTQFVSNFNQQKKQKVFDTPSTGINQKFQINQVYMTADAQNINKNAQIQSNNQDIFVIASKYAVSYIKIQLLIYLILLFILLIFV